MGWIIAALAALAVSLLAFTWYLLKLGWYLLVFLFELALAAGRFVGTIIEAYQERGAKPVRSQARRGTKLPKK